MNNNYTITTRDDLIEHIKKNKLEVKYYFRSNALDIEEDFGRLCALISSPPRLIPSSKLYFDFYDFTDELFQLHKMLDELKYRDLIVIEDLDFGFGAITGSKLLEYLSKLLAFKVELYILDYDNEQLIKIDIRQLLVYIVDALKDDNCTPDFKTEMIEEISTKYYDGKLIPIVTSDEPITPINKKGN